LKLVWFTNSKSSVLAQGSGDNGSFHNLGCTLYGIE
jgi:hypothetical protein